MPLYAAALAEPADKPQLGVQAARQLSSRAQRGDRAPVPYFACSRPAARTFPTIARVLSEGATAGLARSVRGAVVISSRSGLPQGLVAHPLPDGMALFARTLVTDPQFVPLRLTTRRSLHIKAWGVRVRGDILHVLLIDKGSHPLLVGLHLSTVGRASVERLIAPSVRSTSGVTLGGQRLNAQAGWQGKPAAEILAPSTAGHRLTLPRYSAALLSSACGCRPERSEPTTLWRVG